ncbi:MAG: PAS domain S-box protein [Verrucomicrobia bacterium]|nr:PAS domain S-box protein [Verrucomicrobiota bacterium]
MSTPLRVLLIEDSEDDALLVMRELRRGGYEPACHRVETAKAMAAALDQQPWDIVLCDHSLPNFNSIAALDLLKRRGLDLPFIIVSGSIGEDLAVAVMKAGAHDYVMKDRLGRLGPAVKRELREAETIRQRKRAEEALRANEEMLRLLMDSTAEAIYGLDMDGRFTFCNASCLRLLGYADARDLLGKNMHALIHHSRADGTPLAEDDSGIRRSSRQGNGSHAGGHVYWRADGTCFPVEYWSYPVRRDEKLIGVVVTFFDITERKRAEGALKLFRTLVDRTNDAIEVVDPETGRFLDINEKGCLDAGYSREEFLALRVPDIDPTVNQSTFTKLVERLRKTGGLTWEGLRRRKDGSTFPVEVNIKYVRLDQDYIVSAVRDVTARKQAEADLQAAEQKYHGIFENAAEGIFQSTPDGRLLTVNPAFAAMHGFDSPAECLASVRDIAHQLYFNPEHLKKFQHELEERGEVRGYENQARRKDGSVMWVSTSARVTRDPQGRVLYYEGFVEDITERKRVEQEHVRLVTAMEQAAEAVMITDVQGTIQYVNPAFEKIAGYTKQEAIGQNPRILKSGKQDAAFYQQMWATLTRGEVWHGHFINKRKNGTLYKEDVTISPVRDPAGQIVNYIALKLDVTHQGELEAQLRQAQKMEAVGRLAGGVAHDFNNLLTIILGHSELILRHMPPSDPTHERIEEVKRAGERAAELTRQLLAFSRKQVLQPRVLDLNTVVADLGKMLHRLLGEDITLSTTLAPALAHVSADPGQMEQILVNLAVNARDAMPGGGRLTIETANVNLDEAYTHEHMEVTPGRYVMLAVRDTGTGMTAEVKAHLFEPFFTTKEVGKGTGLGLATVFGIIKQSGGHIIVESEAGKGATFKIYLPVTIEAAPAQTAPKPAAKPRRGTETILLVEDDEHVRGLLHACLTGEGYKLLEASNGAQAIEKFGTHPYPIHLLITDVVMPALGGHALVQLLQPMHKDMRVLYISGYSDAHLMQSRIMTKGAAFLQKPFTPDDLVRKVRDVLDKPR